MAMVMLLTGLGYAWLVAQGGAVLAVYGAYTIMVVVLSVVVQTALALANRSDAAAPPDERERLAGALAGNRAGLALAAMVASAALLYAFIGNGPLLFHLVITSLIVAQTGACLGEAWLLRRGI